MISARIEFLRRLDKSGITYVILHGWEELSTSLQGDVDLAVQRKDLPHLLNYLSKDGNYRIVQFFPYEAGSYCLILWVMDRKLFIDVDFTTDYKSKGLIFLKEDYFLSERKRWNELWVLPPEKELIYLIFKKIEKGFIPQHQRSRLQKVIAILGDKAREILAPDLGKKWAFTIIGWISDNQWAWLELKIKTIRKELYFRIIRKKMTSLLRYWFKETGRILFRLRHPTGLSVAIFGPDGIGKTTLSINLQKSLVLVFRRALLLHFRPAFFIKTKGNYSSNDPHAKKAYSFFYSQVKIIYYSFDYSFGYIFKIWYSLVSSTLVIFDRYYDDLLIDPRRYRIKGAAASIRFLSLLIPKPDLTLILDAPEDIILKRKIEVSPEELSRQRAEYKSLLRQLPNSFLVDASQSAEKTQEQACSIIASFLQKRFLERFEKENKDAESQVDGVRRMLFSDKT